MCERTRAVTRAVMAAAMLLASAGAARAQFTTSATATFNVRATVAKNCTVSATSLDFGTYDAVTGAQLDQTSAVSVTCTKNTATRIDLNDGANGTRRMASAASGDFLTYELYQDTSRTLRWGAGSGNGYAWTAPDRAAHNITVYGRVTANQNVAAATDYSDTVTVTVNY